MVKIASREATNAPVLQVNSFLAKEVLLVTMVVMQLLFGVWLMLWVYCSEVEMAELRGTSLEHSVGWDFCLPQLLCALWSTVLLVAMLHSITQQQYCN